MKKEDTYVQCPYYKKDGVQSVHCEGERWERRRWRMKRPERVAAVGRRRSRFIGKEDAGHRNRRRCRTTISRYGRKAPSVGTGGSV